MRLTRNENIPSVKKKNPKTGYFLCTCLSLILLSLGKLNVATPSV